MQSAGPIFGAAHRSVEPFADLFGVEGPFVSLYLDTSPTVEQAAKVVDSRWKNVRRDLAAAGASDAVLDAIEQHIADAHTMGSTLAVIANDDGVQHVAHHPDPPKRDIAVYAPLPRIGPILEWTQKAVPYIVVLTDRTGADITAVRADGMHVELTVDSNDNEDVQKTKPGGWSQARYQRRVENAWEQGASAVAEAVTQLSDEIDTDLIVVGGDVRAVELLCKELPSRLQDVLEVIPGGRGADGSDDAIAEKVERLVASAAAAETVALLQKFREERGQSDRAADGPARVLEALSRAQVETLLVADDQGDERTAWFGPSPEQVSTDRGMLSAMGVDEPQEGRLVDVAIRAAIGTGAGVWIVPRAGGAKDGVGAVLRWA